MSRIIVALGVAGVLIAGALLLVHTLSANGDKVPGRSTRHVRTNAYWEARRHNPMYKRHGLLYRLARRHAAGAVTLLDVGSYIPNILQTVFDWVPSKLAVEPHPAKRAWRDAHGIVLLQADFLKLNLREAQFDLVVCTQVLEHMPDELARTFVRRMQRLCRINGVLIVSVPLNMPAGWVRGHVQDPLGREEFASWFLPERFAPSNSSRLHATRRLRSVHALETAGPAASSRGGSHAARARREGRRTRSGYNARPRIDNNPYNPGTVTDRSTPEECPEGEIVEHLSIRGRVNGPRGEWTWFNGTRIPACNQIVVWRREEE